MSRMSGAHLPPLGFASVPTYQSCNGGKSLAMCGRFDRLGIWTPYLPHQASHHLCHSSSSFNTALSYVYRSAKFDAKFFNFFARMFILFYFRSEEFRTLVNAKIK